MFRFGRQQSDRLMTLGLVLLTGGLGAGIYLALRPLPSPAPRATSAPLTLQAPSSRVLTDDELQLLWQGLDPRTAVPRGAGAPVALPDSMPFRIRGIVYSSAGRSVAFIQSGKDNRLCHVGDTVEGWTLTEIREVSAVFTRDGKEICLSLDYHLYAGTPVRENPSADASAAGEPLDARRTSPGTASGRGKTDVEVTRRVVSSAATGRPPSKADRQDATVSVPVPRDVVERARQDPLKAAEGIKFTPILSDGQMNGITVQAVPSGHVASKYGLLAGDRILAVNGQSLNSMESMMQLYQRYRDTDSIRVTLERGGQRRDVVFYAR